MKKKEKPQNELAEMETKELEAWRDELRAMTTDGDAFVRFPVENRAKTLTLIETELQKRKD